jgi:SAM-dependent methyltransferase
VTHGGDAPDGFGIAQARAAAFPPGEFVGQDSFVTATEIRALARVGDVGPGTRLLDLCCGTGGPGLLVAAELGCRYLGVDLEPDSVAEAGRRAAALGVPAEFMVGRVPPVPDGPFDAVLLIETLLAFPDKDVLVGQVAAALRPGGSFMFTVEEGRPLSAAERGLMPRSDTVWPVLLGELSVTLRQAGLRTVWREEWSHGHADVAASLAASYAELSRGLTPGGELEAAHALVRSHRLWDQWLRSGRIRKFAVVAQRA